MESLSIQKPPVIKRPYVVYSTGFTYDLSQTTKMPDVALCLLNYV